MGCFWLYLAAPVAEPPSGAEQAAVGSCSCVAIRQNQDKIRQDKRRQGKARHEKETVEYIDTNTRQQAARLTTPPPPRGSKPSSATFCCPSLLLASLRHRPPCCPAVLLSVWPLLAGKKLLHTGVCLPSLPGVFHGGRFCSMWRRSFLP